MSSLFSRPKADESPKTVVLGFIFELVQVLAVSLAIIIPVRYFLIQPFYVKGASMEPNFYDNEYLVIDELTFRLRKPVRGEIVVFKYPLDQKEFFIKRIIGLPGETVEVANGSVKIYNDEHPNGFILDEHGYLDQDYTTLNRTLTLKPNEYFVMGDNRAASSDSRYFGAVNASLLTGRVWLRGWPLDKWKSFQPPLYP